MKKKITAALCAAALLVTLAVPMLGVSADYSESDLRTAVVNAINWKNNNDSPMYSIGSNSANLYITALKRLGRSYDYAAYLEGLDGIAAGYGAAHNAADMQRTALAVIAAGGDAQNVGGRDLVADSTYYRDAAASLDKDGADGLAWALILLDSEDFETPDWSIRNRNQIIAGLLSHQNTDGSFDGSVYTTASALTALARYVETSGSYTITQRETGQTTDLSPRNAVNAALTYLSETQTKDGGWDDLISTAMTVIALDTLGIDANKDSRFVARNGSAIDGLMSFRNHDGGFAYDGNRSEKESTSYALCALASHLRSVQNKTALFYMKANDTVAIENTPAPTAAAATTAPRATVTTAPRTSATARPTSTPRVTTAPSNTMRPTRTAAPGVSTDPNASAAPTASPTPKPTRRPDLVGPVEMPGPMQPTDPPEIINGGNDDDTTEKSPVGVIIATISGLLVLAAIAFFAYLKQNGMLPKLSGKKKKTNDDEIKAKTHRKTEQHRRFDNREKYKQRLKYKHKR